MPPLGLLTIAGMFPDNYAMKVVDMNIEPLTDAHLQWADVVFTSTMIVQKASLYEVAERCNQARVYRLLPEVHILPPTTIILKQKPMRRLTISSLVK